MNARKIVMHLLLTGCFFALPAAATPQVLWKFDGTEVGSREDRREAYELAQRFRRAKDDLLTREQVADQAIELGKHVALTVLEAANVEVAKSLKKYGLAFTKQIEKADQITASGVVSSSSELSGARERLIELGNIQAKLQEFLQPTPLREPLANESKAESISRFTEFLLGHEEEAVEYWLLARGYRSLTIEENKVISDINLQRQAAGLEKLDIDYKLCFAARDHSTDMTRKHFFSHTSPVHKKKTFSDRAKRLGTEAYAENIAQSNTGESPVTLWMNSPRHKLIMLESRYNTIGVGRFGNNYTAMFGRRK